MSRREKEKKESLDLLGKLAYSAGSAPPPPPRPAPPAAPRPPPKPAAPPKPARAEPAYETEAERARRKQLAERRDKLAEEKALRDRRASEMARAQNLGWRGSGFTDIPASIRRTGFDRLEPSTAQKIQDVLGEAREKEGRAKAKEKGKRHGGR